MVGASSTLGYNSYNLISGSTLSIFNISSRAGYFAAENLAVGGHLGIASFSQSSTVTTVTAGAFVRYYAGGNFLLGGGISYLNTSASASGFSISTSGVAFPFEAGYAAFVGRNFAIEPAITYVVSNKDTGLEYNGQSVGATSLFRISLGFSLYLNREADQ